MALFFGQWLVRQGCITAEQLLAALDIQLLTNRELGAFAVDAKLLTKKQVDEIHQEQRASDRSFRDIVLEKQWLTKPQVDRLIERQRGMRRYIGEILVQEGMLDFQRMTQELEAFLAERGTQDGEGELDLGSLVRETSETEAYVSACVAMFRRVAQQQLTLHRMEEGATPEHDYTVIQVIDADAQAYIALSLPEAEVLHIATKMAGRGFDTVNQTVLESAKEMLNVIMGNVTGWLSVDGRVFAPEPPQILLDSTTLPHAAKHVTYFFATPEHPVQLIVGL